MNRLTLLLCAAVCFSLGGLAMKLSEGVTRLPYTVCFLGLFCGGALLQARAMRSSDMGPAYIAVLGLEALITLAISGLTLRESWPAIRLMAVTLILAGVILLQLGGE